MITKETLRKQVQVAIRKAVALTSQGQSGAGGWTYTPGSGDEGSVTVTQVQALRAAHNAGFLVPRAVIEESVKYLEKCRTPEGGIQYSLCSGGGPRLPISAAAVATLYNAGQFEGAIATDCLKYVWDQFRANEGWDKGGGHAFYTHLYASQGFYMAGDQYWDDYFPGDPRPVDRHAGSPTAPGTATASARSTAPPSPRSSCNCRTSICRFFSVRSVPREGKDVHAICLKRKGTILSTTTEEIDLAELEELRSAHDQIREQIVQPDRGAGRGRRAIADGRLRPRPLHPGGRSRAWPRR